jgi:hypothetical protein
MLPLVERDSREQVIVAEHDIRSQSPCRLEPFVQPDDAMRTQADPAEVEAEMVAEKAVSADAEGSDGSRHGARRI